MAERTKIIPADEEITAYRRDIHLGDPVFSPVDGDKHERLTKWLNANNIHPETMPIAQVVVIFGEYMRITQFVFDHEGRKQLHNNGLFGFGYACTLRHVPVVAYPEEFSI